MKRSIHQISDQNVKLEQSASNTKKHKPLVHEIKTRQESKEIIDMYHQLQVWNLFCEFLSS